MTAAPSRDVVSSSSWGQAFPDLDFEMKEFVPPLNIRRAFHKKHGMPFALKYGPRNPAEANVLEQLEHPNIARLHHVYEWNNEIVLVLEMEIGVSLQERLRSRTFTNEQSLGVMRQLLSAVEYMHTNGVVHHDITLEKIYFATSSDWTIKVVGFEHASIIVDEDEPLTCQIGTPAFMSPEVVLGLKHGYPVDMWASGVVMFNLLAGFPPFHEDDHSMLGRQITDVPHDNSRKYFTHVPQAATDLLGVLLAKQPHERPTAAEALRHEWFHETVEAAPVGAARFVRMLKKAVIATLILDRMHTLGDQYDNNIAAAEPALYSSSHEA